MSKSITFRLVGPFRGLGIYPALCLSSNHGHGPLRAHGVGRVRIHARDPSPYGETADAHTCLDLAPRVSLCLSSKGYGAQVISVRLTCFYHVFVEDSRALWSARAETCRLADRPYHLLFPCSATGLGARISMGHNCRSRKHQGFVGGLEGDSSAAIGLCL